MTEDPRRSSHRLRTAEEYRIASEREDAEHPSATHPCDGHLDCFCKLSCGCHWVIEGGVSE